jgi:hypothetical protein
MSRYHLMIEETRTTVTVDTTLSNLLAVKLNTDPIADAATAHAAVRGWLQDEIDRDPGAYVLARRGVTNRNSQRLQKYALLAVAAPHLVRRLEDCETRNG